jgi:hypothetical protein
MFGDYGCEDDTKIHGGCGYTHTRPQSAARQLTLTATSIRNPKASFSYRYIPEASQ